MRVEVHNRCSDFNSYRAARVKSLFNCESGANFKLAAELPIDDQDWKIGIITGPSGSGKTSIAKQVMGEQAFYNPRWKDGPIVDEILPDGEFDDVTAALAAVGLGDVHAWLRPYSVLSQGEQFRATMARLICDRKDRVVLDNFTDPLDRKIARFASLAFSKAWKRGTSQAILITPHRDIVDWVEPDWVFDTATGKYAGRGLWRRPKFELEIRQTDWSYWPMFEPHHYLKLPPMVAAACYVGLVDGEPVAHVAFSTRPGLVEARACRLVVMPEWQGAGIGMRFLNAICELWRRGRNRYKIKVPTLFHTSHPGLCAGLRRDPRWTQVSAYLYGGDKTRSIRTLMASGNGHGGGYGGHFRAVQGFRYLGE